MADEIVTFTCVFCGARAYRVDEIGQYVCAECHRYAHDVAVSARPDPAHPVVEMLKRLTDKIERARQAGRIR